MRAINHGLPIPMPFVPLAGAAAGFCSAFLFGVGVDPPLGHDLRADLARRRRARLRGDVHAARSFGGEEGITANRTRRRRSSGSSFGSQLAGLLRDRRVGARGGAADARFMRTPVGRMCNAVRDNPERAEFVGYNTQHVRFFAFAVAGMFAGLAGGLNAINYEIVAADSRERAALGYRAADGLHRRRHALRGSRSSARHADVAADQPERLHGAWHLYLGLFFMAIILFAPSGSPVSS
jgi:branched-chain amino acid transport system permease protein